MPHVDRVLGLSASTSALPLLEERSVVGARHNWLSQSLDPRASVSLVLVLERVFSDLRAWRACPWFSSACSVISKLGQRVLGCFSVSDARGLVEVCHERVVRGIGVVVVLLRRRPLQEPRQAVHLVDGDEVVNAVEELDLHVGAGLRGEHGVTLLTLCVGAVHVQRRHGRVVHPSIAKP